MKGLGGCIQVLQGNMGSVAPSQKGLQHILQRAFTVPSRTNKYESLVNRILFVQTVPEKLLNSLSLLRGGQHLIKEPVNLWTVHFMVISDRNPDGLDNIRTMGYRSVAYSWSEFAEKCLLKILFILSFFLKGIIHDSIVLNFLMSHCKYYWWLSCS